MEIEEIWAATNSTVLGSVLPCDILSSPQHILFQLANFCFFISYLTPSERKGLLFMHTVLIVGYMLYSTWAWNIICAPDVFSWTFSFMIINMGQTLYIIYQLRPVKFNKELEDVYQTLFQPLQVPRTLFKRLVSVEYAQILSLHSGEAYALQGLTRTDRLGLLISGKVNVMMGNQFLHTIVPMQFLDSPEFESSRATFEDKFKVSIVAAMSCHYVFWQRTSLEYLFVKEPYLATIMLAIVARDIIDKLYSMNEKILTEVGSHLDIRLPSLTSSLSSCCDVSSKYLIQTPLSGAAGTEANAGEISSNFREMAAYSGWKSRSGYTVLPTIFPGEEIFNSKVKVTCPKEDSSSEERGWSPSKMHESTPPTEKSFLASPSNRVNTSDVSIDSCSPQQNDD